MGFDDDDDKADGDNEYNKDGANIMISYRIK